MFILETFPIFPEYLQLSQKNMKTLLIQFVFVGGGGGGGGGGLRKQGVFVFRAIFACLGEELGEKLFFAYNL